MNALNVKSADELIALFRNSTTGSVNVDIDIINDLDFSNTDLVLPLGAKSKTICTPYGGVLHGNGHLIKGLVINSQTQTESSDAGLFCALEDAIVMNLVFDSSCIFEGKNAGALGAVVRTSLSIITLRTMLVF